MPLCCPISDTQRPVWESTFRVIPPFHLEFTMGLKSIFAAIAVTCCTATAASATTILYDFTNNLSDDSSTLTYTEGGQDLRVDASRRDNANSVLINRGGRGLGVSPGREGGRLGRDEVLTFTIESGREISGLSVSLWERGTEDEVFSIVVNGVSTNFTVLGGGSGASTQTFDLSSLFSSDTNTFSIVGESSGPGNRGGRLSSIEVTLVPVPLPASGALLLSSLAIVTATRRKRARA